MKKKKNTEKRAAMVIVAVFARVARTDRLGSRADLFAVTPPPPV